jgi:hypothetical protein
MRVDTKSMLAQACDHHGLNAVDVIISINAGE